MEDLPAFRYHHDPVQTGSVVPSAAVCLCCEAARGYVYAGPVYAEADGLDEAICPWCIADGSAARKFDAEFVDPSLFEELDEEIADTVSRRTPGYAAWQQEEWPVCCDDATAFYGPVGYGELKANFDEWEYEVTLYIVNELRILNNEAVAYLKSLQLNDGGPTAYLFKCRHCDARYARIDSL